MAELRGTMLRVTILLLVIGCVSAKSQRKSLRFSVDAGLPVTVKLYLQDFPNRQKTFSQVQGVVRQGSNIFLTVQVDPKDLPDVNSVDKQYVYLVAKSDDGHFQFHKEAKILLSYRDGMVFIQTDKPVYTPRQSDYCGSHESTGIKVEQWKDLDTSTGIISKRLDLGDFIIHGNWTITATYGHQNIHNTSVQFEVKEYVLPKFSVKLTVPPYILKTDNRIEIKITSRYTYGKPVRGTAVVYLSIAGFDGQIIKFGKHTIVLDESGVTTVPERIQIIQDLPGDLWFPEKSRLLVEADVIEGATGNKETAVDNSCQFTSSPYLIKFINTAKYFKPGLRL
ncbi:hypothetical protein OS493_014901 [Desmophyllum pertusum]|uniref:Uncharacterized protein n=1 Tax=Desmophyllum pertusum TaxID=174260 RepID=A0A9W9YDE5_9CNID|nr:hypothetical protein OS493_014901 [Desmophyllum pertusum]